MKTKNKLLTLMMLTGSACITIGSINKFIQIKATSKEYLGSKKSLCYKWRLGNIHYTKEGTGQPLLLIHNLSASSSGYEWHQLVPFLKDHYTVYTIDLLGCGRSEKPNLTYTNYLYVQLITDFIKSVIGHRTSIIASLESTLIPIMACSSNPDIFDQLLLINPPSIQECKQFSGHTSKIYKKLLDTPLIGTLLYNISSSKKELINYFKTIGFFNPYNTTHKLINTYYESAHLGLSPKSVYASVRCNYTKCNISHALKKINNSIYVISNSDKLNYHLYNSSIEFISINETKALPQLEKPHTLSKIIKTYLG